MYKVCQRSVHSWCQLRYLSCTAAVHDARFPPRQKLENQHIQEVFLKGSGPGGQKINKTASAVQIKHLPTGIVVKSQATRSRSQNREIARRLLSDKLEVIEKGSESRTAIKADIKRRRKASKTKKAHRKHKQLEPQEAEPTPKSTEDFLVERHHQQISSPDSPRPES